MYKKINFLYKRKVIW